MPYQVQQIIEGRGKPICVSKGDPVTKALSCMIEYDYSQLPVIRQENDMYLPEGMVTYESILRGIRNFQAKLESLKVRDVMVSAPVYSLDDDLFDILDRLKETNAVLVISGHGPDLVGIVTSYDSTEYFRNRTEDFMRVADIELMVKEFIKAAYTNKDGDLNSDRLASVVDHITGFGSKGSSGGEKKKTFDDLTLYEYITLLLNKETWSFFENIFDLEREFVHQLLHGVREVRNALAHFRGDLTADQRDRLRFGMEWLSRCQEEFQERKQKEQVKNLIDQGQLTPSTIGIDGKSIDQQVVSVDSFTVAESYSSGGKYAALADWLRSRPGSIAQVQLTFNQIEEIIGADLPASAHNHRVWWANDSEGKVQSKQWLEAGWRSTYVNLREGKVTFARIREREKAYISFFNKLVEELRKKAPFSVREISPDGSSWVVIQGVTNSGISGALFGYSFSRESQFRVELYIDMGDQARTKAVFDRLNEEKEVLENQLGALRWERLDNKRASRIAAYHPGQITDEENLPKLRAWAVETMIKFIDTLKKPIETAIAEVAKS